MNEENKTEMGNQIQEAIRNYIELWKGSVRYPSATLSSQDGLISLDDTDYLHMDGNINLALLAEHIADVLNDTPKRSFTKALAQMKAEQDAEDAMTPYQKIWERQGRWLTGESLLKSVIEFLKDKSLVVCFDVRYHTAIQVTIPLPLIETTNVDNEPILVGLSELIPEQLLSTFSYICNCEILNHYSSLIRDMENNFKGVDISKHTLAHINALFKEHELLCKARQEPMLWERTAKAFGIHPYFNLINAASFKCVPNPQFKL